MFEHRPRLVMGVQALVDVTERMHLLGDVPALVVVVIVLIMLAPVGVPRQLIRYF